ncbi:hypothetical protein K488DRAFT_56000, partial [Vararia minispora EC-137]
ETAIFRNALTRSAKLEETVSELRRELEVWKLAYKTQKDEHEGTRRMVARLERNIDSLKDDNPLLVCLIDGDGTIFAQELWLQGRSGGRQAASLLTKGIIEHATSLSEGLSSRCQVWLAIYCNRKGLMDTLITNCICSSEHFEDFIHGFNEASPLFSIVDVGTGKEAADAKIKEHLRLFTRFPQAVSVYLGGSHDNGYSTAINHLVNEGLGSKLVLLKGKPLKNVDLPQLEIDGLFMARKLTNPPHLRHGSSSPKKQILDFDKFRNKVKTEDRLPTPTLRRFDPSLVRYKPQPCTYYYMTKCKTGDSCKYGHDYERTPELIAAIRQMTKLIPCTQIQKNLPCLNVNCMYGHSCPHGEKCSQYSKGTCKFKSSKLTVSCFSSFGKHTQQRAHTHLEIRSAPVLLPRLILTAISLAVLA